ncbi:MAG: helix-turn-helix domain-containing protein [Gammaproteobacteria bacterium]|nr:helix-turn-helix domain-containing protein [Gammaproteobacteria bacterium]MBU2005590.1 helix-turn-helix domain-containing protein [Gammaproteobacteria bacterium]
MDPLKLLGSEIRQRRLDLGLSQEELAALCDLHRTYIGSVERGERNISLQNIISIAHALKCKPSQLVAGVDKAV